MKLMDCIDRRPVFGKGGGCGATFPVLRDAATTTAARLADRSGSILVDPWRNSDVNPTSTESGNITGGAQLPTISAAAKSVIKSEDTGLTGWTTGIASGILDFKVDSPSTVTLIPAVLTGVVC